MKSQVRVALVDDGEFGATALAKSVGAVKTYNLPRANHVVPWVFAGFALLGAPIVIAGVAALLLDAGHSHFLNGSSGTAGGIFTMFLVGVLAAGRLSLYLLRIPFEIGITDEPIIEFRSWLRTLTLTPYEVISICTGGWTDPQAVNLVIKYKGGRLCLSNKFSNFRDFLVTIKSLNPSVEIRGF